LAALAIWGVYLSIGAAGFFTGAIDLRRTLIVAVCWIIFLAFTFWVVTRGKPRDIPDAPSNPPALAPVSDRWNRASLASGLMVGTGYLLWGAAWIAWRSAGAKNMTSPLGWFALAAMGTAAVCAVIGLSDRRARRGHLAGLWTLGGLVVAIVVFILQVRHFVHR
jgi:hypothetical protein